MACTAPPLQGLTACTKKAPTRAEVRKNLENGLRALVRAKMMDQPAMEEILTHFDNGAEIVQHFSPRGLKSIEVHPAPIRYKVRKYTPPTRIR